MKAYEKLDLAQGSDAWLKARESKFNGSKAGVLFNVDPYTTPLQYAEEKIYGTKPSTKGKERLFETGHAVEEQARDYANSKLGFHFVPSVILSNSVTRLLVSNDGLDEARGVGLEAKFVGLESLKKVYGGDLPPHHVYQVQAGLLASGFDEWLYMATHKDEFVQTYIKADKELHKVMTDKINEFMDACERGELPEPTDRDYFEPADSRFADLIHFKETMDLATKRFDALKEELAKDFEIYARIRYNNLTMVRTTRKGNVNYNKIPDLKKIDLELYRGAPISSVTVKLTKAK